MEVRNCIRCGKTFTYVNKPICGDCVVKDAEEFEQVRAYIKENMGCSPHEVSSATNVPIKRIMKYVRDGRIDVEKNPAFVVTCEKCGKAIKKGRLCKGCQSVLSNQIAVMSRPERKVRPDSGGDSKGMFIKKSER